jgi:hypothetical protein
MWSKILARFFDAKSLVAAPLPPDLMVDALMAALAKLQAMGMGSAGVRLPDGLAVNAVDLVANFDAAAYFVVKHK